jgi:CBS domain-containing protein
MNRVKDILSRKGATVYSLPSSATVLEALEIMSDKNIGSLVITDEQGKYKGIVSERDYSRKVALKGKSSTNTLVFEIMSMDSVRISPFDTVEYCMQTMTDNNIRYLPVFVNDELKGIVSMSDVVKETILQQKETINHLESYIYLNR